MGSERKASCVDEYDLPPKAPEWVEDGGIDNCMLCGVVFSFPFTRKHHCRVCGKIFCDHCTDHQIDLPRYFGEISGLQRACFTCFSKFTPIEDSSQRFIQTVCEAIGDPFKPLLITRGMIKGKDDTEALPKRLVLVCHLSIICFSSEPSDPTKWKIAENFHILDLSGIQFDGKNDVLLSFLPPGSIFKKKEDKKGGSKLKREHTISFKIFVPNGKRFVEAVKTSYKKATNFCSELVVEVEGRQEDWWKQDDEEDYFTISYRAVSSYLKIPVSHMAIDLIDFLTSLPSPEIDLNLLPHPPTEARSEFPSKAIAGALQYNRTFTSIIFSEEEAKYLFSSLTKNSLICSLQATMLSAPSLRSLSSYLPLNQDHMIQVIDFQNCRFSHESICHFAVAFRSLTHGFSSLTLKNCGLTPKDVDALVKKGFLQNMALSASLRHLDLSENKLGEVGSEALGLWLSHMEDISCLQRVAFSKCEAEFVSILSALRSIRGIEQVILSHNSIDRETFGVLRGFCEISRSLLHLDLSYCSLPSSVVSSVVSAVMLNAHLSQVNMNLAHNEIDDKCEIYGPGEVFGTLSYLDLSGAKLTESGFVALCRGVSCSENPFETIIFNDCLLPPPPPPQEGEEAVLEVREERELGKMIVQMCDDCPSLRALSFVQTFTQHKHHLFSFLCQIEHQKSLLELDISGHPIGDSLAFAIGRVLRNNNTLAALHFDGNLFGEAGFRMIRASLFDNSALQLLSFPWKDISLLFTPSSSSSKPTNTPAPSSSRTAARQHSSSSSSLTSSSSPSPAALEKSKSTVFISQSFEKRRQLAGGSGSGFSIVPPAMSTARVKKLKDVLMDIQGKVSLNRNSKEFPFDSILKVGKEGISPLPDPPFPDPLPLVRLPQRFLGSGFIQSMHKWEREYGE